MATHWQGVFPAATTQLKKDQSLDLDATARHLEALIESGVAGLIMLGSLGENQTLDPAEKRKLLQEVARAPAVDSIRRKRAANDLAALGGETIDVSELPSAPSVKPERSAAATAAKPSDPPHAGEPTADAAPTGGKVATGPATLVRKNPFDDPGAAEIAPPVDPSVAERSRLIRVKNLLLSKVRNGSASDADLKQLHSLCRTLGDASCSN